MFDVWALPGHQLPPPGEWRTWLILGGRGAGKTRAGAEWVRSMAEGPTPLAPGRRRRVALIAETFDQAREVMVEGESGIRAVSPPDRAPHYEVTRKRLVWPNGAEARLFSAQDPESLRGPQFDAAWCDELAKWKHAREVWDMLQFGLRLGDAPQQIVTTTPRRVPLLTELMRAPDTVVTHAPTEANRANLAPGFIEAVERRFKGTSLGRQELMGELLTEAPGALWTRATIERGRAAPPDAFERIVVAVDPPVTGKAGSDECGIVVAGLARGVAWVLEDASVQGAAPRAWAERAVAAYHAHEADRLVAEVNQGGDLVEALVRQVDPLVSYRAVRATRGKAARAEPVAALYEQGRVRHGGLFPALEDQMCAFTGDRSEGSPDRVDALVWAVTELMLSAGGAPRVRRL
ncbi:DNA-packaging protein [Oceanicella actignis]|uniref:DNA-packaging protein n=1 Tax=Oceanicella actignis TaxID=1189325 RepID=UPI0035142B72